MLAEDCVNGDARLENTAVSSITMKLAPIFNSARHNRKIWKAAYKERIRCQISVQPDRLLSAMILRSQRIPNSVRVSFSFDNSMAAQLVLRDYDLSKCSRGVAHGLA